ncbi:spore germination protein YaaH [Tumebacillus sp. BK434]|uniref:LysM peptidoglycan-binding domain-containing protein n=1 Tax=Tumebacillus sp. BK434 TaxID=2512169 RepID=UPI0010530FE8|nr:glycosyl hydrolase family 18 protein [Tumebacillus sp. BK434]TCP59222.1 spore germination protein YaaH [Tumebacillus sp. BK434]
MSQKQLTYVIVQAGDTLAAIAKRYFTTVGTIARLNGLQKDAVPIPGTLLHVPKIPPKQEPKQKLFRPRIPRYAFAVHTGREGVYPGSDKALLKVGAEGLSGIFPVWFQPSPTEPWELQSFVTPDVIAATTAAARERNVQVWAMLTNSYYTGSVSSKEVAHQVMTADPDRLLNNLFATYTRCGLDGVLLDWFDLYADDHELFTVFLFKMADMCRRSGLKLAVNIPLFPDGEGRPTAALDLELAGQLADLVCLLLNTEHRMYTGAGPLSSISWTENGIRHALEKGVPPHKLLLGVAGYAYDWKGRSETPEYLSFEGALNRARQYRTNVQFDAKSQTPTCRYTDGSGAEHQVWFENTSSMSQKITLVDRYGLAGITMWRLGVEDPGLWTLLRSRWNEVKKLNK